MSDAGERCPARTFLELDHIEPRALGGGDEPANLRIRCRAHNRLYAEQVFGKERVARAIRFRQRKGPPVATSEGPPADTFREAARGLTNMGFRSTEAQRALTTVIARRPPGASVQDVLREALALLS